MWASAVVEGQILTDGSAGLGHGLVGVKGRCCRTLSARDSLYESMRLDGWHDEAQACPLPHEELVELQRRAQKARLTADLSRHGDDLARAA